MSFLQMAVKALNVTAGLDGFVPTLLPFESYLRMINMNLPAPDITARAKAINKAIAEDPQSYLASVWHTGGGNTLV